MRPSLIWPGNAALFVVLREPAVGGGAAGGAPEVRRTRWGVGGADEVGLGRIGDGGPAYERKCERAKGRAWPRRPAAGSEWPRPERAAGDNRPGATRRLQCVARGTVTPSRL